MSSARSAAKFVVFCMTGIMPRAKAGARGDEAAGDGAGGTLAGVKARLAPRDLALILIVVAVWGFSFVPIKVGLREVPPFALAAMRFFFAAVPLVFFIPWPQMPTRFVVGYGFAIGVVQFGLLFLGMKLGMPAGLSSIVIQIQVFFTIGLGIAFLGDRLHGENVAGAIIAAASPLPLVCAAPGHPHRGPCG